MHPHALGSSPQTDKVPTVHGISARRSGNKVDIFQEGGSSTAAVAAQPAVVRRCSGHLVASSARAVANAAIPAKVRRQCVAMAAPGAVGMASCERNVAFVTPLSGHTVL